MKERSICQNYLLCALNEKGKVSALHTEIPVCLLAGGLIDLITAKSVTIGEDKKLSVTGELSVCHHHLDSLYHFIKESKPMKVDQLATEYMFTFSDKRIKQLMKDIGTSLADLGCVVSEHGGLFGNASCFIPDASAVDHVIQNIRAELLEDGVVADDIVALVSLLDRSNQIKRYFSKYEKDQLRSRLKEITTTDSNQLVKEMVAYIDTLVAVIAATSAH